MNSQEREELEHFLDQLARVRRVEKVAEADEMIERAFDRQPDAPYLLVQRVLLLGRALNQAKARIAALERAQQEPSARFLDSEIQSSGVGSAASAAPPIAMTGHAPSAALSPGATSAGTSVSAPGSAAPGFLGQAAATAAGVAGGAFLFEGIEGLFEHHTSPVPGYEAIPSLPQEDVTINNYYSGKDNPHDVGDARFAGDDAEGGADTDADFEGNGDNDFV